jgi:TRAP-type C4-dicarboxylate transport system substrate-binding protein
MKTRAWLCSVMLLVAAAVSAPAAAQKVLKVGIGLSDDHPQGQAVKKFGELLAQKSGGTVTADSSTLASLIKDFGILNLPLTFNNEQEADALLDGPFGKKLLDQLPDKGLIGLAF